MVLTKDIGMSTTIRYEDISYDDHKEWYAALTCNDIEKVKTILYERDGYARACLLHGKFDYGSADSVHKFQMVNAKYPLSIAVLSGSKDIVQILLKEESIDPLETREDHGYNIIHCLIAKCYFNQNDMGLCIDMYNVLVEILEDKIQELLFDENELHQRPLEMAMDLELMKFFETVFKTKRVYLTRSNVRGPIQYLWYDITDYETFGKGNRRSRSPINYLAKLSLENLGKEETKNIFQWDVMQTWIDSKIHCNRWLIILWFILRMALILFFYTHEDMDILHPPANNKPVNITVIQELADHFNIEMTNDSYYYDGQDLNEWLHKNLKEPSIFGPHLRDCMYYMQGTLIMTLNVKIQLLISFIAYGIFSILFDIISLLIWLMNLFVNILSKPKNIRRHSPAVCSLIYRIAHFLLVFSIISSILAIELLNNFFFTVWFSVFTHVFVPFSIFYFVQLLPRVGYFVTCMHSMSNDVITFMLVFFIWCIPLAHGFVYIFYPYKACNVIDGSHFTTMVYDAFRVVLNMIDFSEAFENMDREGVMVLQVYHFFFVFFMGLLLLNLLIAMFSSTVANIALHKHEIIVLQRLNVTMMVENRMASLLRIVYRRLQRKFLKHENGHIYLVEAVGSL